jgi:hypothetical protein
MSLYADYLLENRGDLVEERPEGFAVYRYLDDTTVYIVDIYVVVAERQNGIASELANRVAFIAKLKGCTTMLGTVDTRAKHASRSMVVLLAYGMRFKNIDGHLLVFEKVL